MKKIMAVLLAIMMVLTLGACGSNNESAPQEEAAPTEKIVIKFAAQGDSTPATQQSIDDFNASQDKYEVVWEDMSNDSGAMKDALKTSLSAGSSDYDVISMDVCWAGEFAAAGYITPIDEMLQAAGLKISDFNAGSMAAATYNAKTYALPFFPDLGVLFFRKDIVSEEDAAKLVAGDYTWADLQAMAETYKGQGDTTEGYLFQAKQGECLVCNAAEFTAGWTDIEGGLVAFKALTDSEGTPADILNYAEGETEKFMTGAAVFARNWPYMKGCETTLTDDQIGYAPLPGGSCVGGWLLGINKNSANPEGAFEFLKYLATEGQVVQATVGTHLPGYNAALENADVLGANAMLTDAGFQKALATTVSRPVSSAYGEASDAIQINVHAYLAGDAELADTVAAVEAALAK
ncbi:MAG: extracellular solute-binding protein [Erysipelotrichaceae bacterium]|nr:extracellular solute-binding protein [Erysipelotrichaceae bacterium]